MKTDALLSAKFGRMPHKQVFEKMEKPNVVVYTRVSSKEQADKNLSLETQRKTIQDCVDRTGRNVVGFFGGTYESAKTDGRKEFQRMLEFIKKSKGKVQEIMVYALDRFSRTGGAAIKLATDLREKYGVNINAVTQPVDTSNPSGVLSQGMHLLFSEFDNKLRSQRVVAGLKAKFEKGIWSVKPPQGYDTITVNGERKLVVNEEGRKIAKAFEWKIQGLMNIEIMERLKAMGVKRMNKMQVQRILTNPFYCGMIAHGMLNGKVIEGKHEKLISREMFLKVNRILEGSTRFNIPHMPDDIKLPLKVFLWCDECCKPLTGYRMKVKVRKGAEQAFQYYYKCRTKGCRFNRNVREVHEKWEALLAEITIKPELIEPLLFQLERTFSDLNAENINKEKYLNERLTEVKKKMDVLEEKYFMGGEMGKETYDKFNARYKLEIAEISSELENCRTTSSNHTDLLKSALKFSSNLLIVWKMGGVGVKEKFQKLLFPEGLVYDRKNGVFRTQTINSLIAVIARLSGDSALIEKEMAPIFQGQSRSAEKEGFEPPDLLQSTVFKTAALDRSAISPGRN
jgi:site-specific DNA recombinase